MRFHWQTLLVCAFTVLTLSDAAHAEAFRIRYAEPISLQDGSSSHASAIRALANNGRLSFQAYGRQFDLELESNTGIARALAAKQQGSLEGVQLLRGRLQGLPGSWARITRVGEELSGAFWDGTDLYTIAPARVVNRFTVAPLAVTGSSLVLYRLSDVDTDLGPQFCGTAAPADESTALSAYKSLVEELNSKQALAATMSAGQIDVAVVGDFEFFSAYPDNTQAELLARMNIVDGIYSGQVGVSIGVSEVRVFTTPDEPFTTNSGANLLEQLGVFREGTPEFRDRGLTHLFTGRDIEDNMAGIAYVGTLCDGFHGVGISEGRYDLTTTALIAAHEIGHNFGAVHDGEAGSACADTAPMFLMAAQINGSNTFSQCSLERIQPRILSASCITPPSIADVSVEETPAVIEGISGQSVVLPVNVTSVGTAQVGEVTLTTALFASVSVESATVEGGSCSEGAGNITCQLGALDAGSSRLLSLHLRPASPGTFTSTVNVSSSDDVNAMNNSRTVSLVVSPELPAPVGGAGGGGGGGVTEFATLMTLLALLFRRQLRYFHQTALLAAWKLRFGSVAYNRASPNSP